MDNKDTEILNWLRENRPEAMSSPTGQTGNSAAAAGEPGASTSQPTPEMIVEAGADNLRDATAAGQIYAALLSTFPSRIPAESFRVYRDRLIRDSGNPTDPIEIMALEQIAIAHFHIGRLFVKACSMENHKLATAYTDAATRLFAEFRRTILALEDFRAKQIARKERAAGIDAGGGDVPAKSNGKPHRPSGNGKKTRPTKVRNNGHSEVPEWLEKRMAYPTPSGSQLGAVTG